MNSGVLEEYFSLRNQLQSMPLNFNTAEEDQICWKLESSRKYAAKSTYTTQFDQWQHRIQFPQIDLESLGTPKMQALPMASPTGSTIYGRRRVSSCVVGKTTTFVASGNCNPRDPPICRVPLLLCCMEAGG